MFWEWVCKFLKLRDLNKIELVDFGIDLKLIK